MTAIAFPGEGSAVKHLPRTSASVLRRTAFLVIPLAASSFLLPSCQRARSAQGHETSATPSLPVILPQVVDAPYLRSFVAEIQSREHIALKAHAAGFIEEILVEEGATVKKGQHLFTVAAREAAADLRKSEAEKLGNATEVRVAEIELENTRRLFERRIIARPELELAEVKLEAARAKLEESIAEVSQTALKLDYAKVLAPADGVIGRIPNKVGSRVEEGELLTQFSSSGDAYVYFNVSEKEALGLMRDPDLRQRAEVRLELADGTAYPEQGKVDSWDTMVSKETGTVAFRASFANAEGWLKHGSTGRITITTKVPDALVIPQRATFEVQHKLCVFVLEKDNIIRMKTIVPRHRLQNHFVIESGLEKDDRIVYEGIQLVKEGDIAMAEMKEPADPLPL